MMMESRDSPLSFLFAVYIFRALTGCLRAPYSFLRVESAQSEKKG